MKRAFVKRNKSAASFFLISINFPQDNPHENWGAIDPSLGCGLSCGKFHLF